METKYDRVAYPENAYLHSDGEHEEFGTGVYPGVSIISRNYKNDDTIKIACFRIQKRFKLFLIIGCILVLFFICLAIVLATTGKEQHANSESAQHPINHPNTNTNNKKYGLFYQPQLKDSSQIKFDPLDITTYKEYLNALDFHMHDYNSVNQQDSHLIDCHNGTAPPDSFACRQPAKVFGEECTHLQNYGYIQGRPCVLLTLKLNESFVPVPFAKNSDVATHTLRSVWSRSHVGVTCDGETVQDRKQIGNNMFVSQSGKPEDPIDIQPVQGFSTSFFPKKSEKYVAPSVMVQFNTLKFNRFIQIKCVAWASNFNDGAPQSSELYTAKFKIYIGQ